MKKDTVIKMDDNDLMFGNQFKKKPRNKTAKKTVKRTTPKKKSK